MITIRESNRLDLPALLAVGCEAFGEAEGPEIVRLVEDLLEDLTADPLSLVALEGSAVVGHILFSRAWIEPGAEVPAAILAPLAVAPGWQGRGVGGSLIECGLRLLCDRGVGLVFVLGHPTYYPRSGFQPAAPCGLEAPYPIAEEFIEAWMVRELKPGLLGRVVGRVHCAEKLDRPEYWR